MLIIIYAMSDSLGCNWYFEAIEEKKIKSAFVSTSEKQKYILFWKD
jgi:hypothetical protein